MFSARRKPKRVARDEPDRTSNDDEEEQAGGPVVRRPNLAPKTKSKLRTSFAPDEAEDSSDAPVVVKPKPRIGQTPSSQSLPRFNIEDRAQDETISRPSYSKTALQELRNSTPTTPKDLSVYDPSSSGTEDGIRKLDLASKFDAQASTSAISNAIPSAAEIAEKKSRRARLAKEQAAEDFIPLEDDQLYDSDGEFKPRRMQVGTYLRADANEKEETRLVRDDEDILEGFDDYTEDAESNRITMGRKQLLQAQRRDRDAMRELIDHAEGGRSSDNDNEDNSDSDSEIERNHAYETAQTAHGMDGLSAAKAAARRAGRDRPRQPREVTPVPKLSAALNKLRERIARVELERVKVERRRAEIRKERADVLASQEHIQRSLTEAGEELERIRQKQEKEQAERGLNGGGGVDAGSTRGGAGLGSNNTGMAGRGLDSMGLTPEPS